jgi:hypothetical protein
MLSNQRELDDAKDDMKGCDLINENPPSEKLFAIF